MSSAELEANLRFVLVSEAGVFDLSGDLIYGARVSLKIHSTGKYRML